MVAAAGLERMQIAAITRVASGSLSGPLRSWTPSLRALLGRPAGVPSANRTSSSGRGAARWGAAGGCGAAVRALSTAGAAEAAAGGGGSGVPRVCILGGGFGGLYTAVKLETLLWPRGTKPQVTLIEQNERFVFKPLLYELLSGAATAEEVAPPLAQLLAPYPVTLLRGRVAGVQPEPPTPGGSSGGGGQVLLQGGGAVPYDWLVLALGAETADFGVPGVKECALPFSTYEHAVKVDERLRVLEAAGSQPDVVVVGGGYAGVEVAAVVAERLGGRARLRLVTSDTDILAAAPEGQREAARRALQDKGVSILTGAKVTEMRMAAGGGAGASGGGGGADLAKRLVYVRDSEGQQEILEADLVLWSAGQSPISKMGVPGRPELPFPTSPRGATETDPTLRVLGHQRVFALGDVAVAGSGGAQHLPATAQVAFQQADYVAWNVWAAINDKPLLSFSYQHLGDMMSLGSAGGAVALPIPVPPPLSAAAQSGVLGQLLRAAGVRVSGSYGGATDGITLEGPLAAALRRAAYLYRQPTLEQQLRVAGSWAETAAKQAQQVAAAVLSGRMPTPGGRDGGAP